MAALDVDEDHADLMEFAFADPERRGLPLHALHVFDDPWTRDQDVHEDVLAVAKRTVDDLESGLAESLLPYRDRLPHAVTDAGVHTSSIGSLLVQDTSTADLVVVCGHRCGDGGGSGRRRTRC